jgi:hypothetical protein
VGNFETIKHPKAGYKVLSILYYEKVAFGFGFCDSQPLWLDFWLLVKSKAAKSPTKGTMRMLTASTCLAVLRKKKIDG